MRNFILSSLVVLAGCDNKQDAPPAATAKKSDAEQLEQLAPVAAKHKEATGKMLAALATVAADAKKSPPIASREPIADPAAIPSGEPILVSSAWIEDPKRDFRAGSFEKRVISGPFGLGAAIDVLAGGLWNPGGGVNLGSVEERFRQIEALRYAAVVRIHFYKKPTAGSETFDPARASGDVILYSLPDAKRLGAFPFEATGAWDKVRAKSAEGAEAELEEAFERELPAQVQKEIAAYTAGKASVAAAKLDANTDELAKQLGQELTLWWAASPTKPSVGTIDVVIEPGPVVTLKVDKPHRLEPGRDEITPRIAKALGVEPTEVKIVQR